MNHNFDFISDTMTRNAVSSGYNTINKLNEWEFLKVCNPESFMFSSNPKINSIMNSVNDDYGGGHSGCSISLTMRALEYIAKHGYTGYKQQWVSDDTYVDSGSESSTEENIEHEPEITQTSTNLNIVDNMNAPLPDPPQ